MTRRILKRLYYSLLAVARAHHTLIDRLHTRNKIVVLNLHQISPHENHFWPPLHPVVFEELVEFLKRHFHVTTFRDIDATPNDKPLAILSFDDGYYDFLEYAVPILTRHNISANMNIIPLCVQTGAPPWNIQLYDFLNGAPRRVINEIKIPGFHATLLGDDAHSKVRFGLAISAFLKKRPRVERDSLWFNIAEALRKHDLHSRTRMMSANEVKAASASYEFGVHSFSHESMGFEDDEFFRADLEKCNRFFVSELQIVPKTYAFPNGSYKQHQIEILRAGGYENILLVDNDFADRTTHVFPRLTLYGESKWEARFLGLGYRVRHKLRY